MNLSGTINKYKNIKTKLYNKYEAIWYNKTCRLKHVTPRYINIKVNGNKHTKPKNEEHGHTLQNKSGPEISLRKKKKTTTTTQRAAIECTLGMRCLLA